MTAFHCNNAVSHGRERGKKIENMVDAKLKIHHKMSDFEYRVAKKAFI